MQFIDTHSHLYSSQFDEDRTNAVNEAIAAGVSTILLPNISSEYTKGMLELCSEFPNNCFPMMGLHPCYVNENYDEGAVIYQHKQPISLGETGLTLSKKIQELEHSYYPLIIEKLIKNNL